MNPTRRGFLAGSVAFGALSALGLPRIAAAANPPRKLVIVHARGGWDVSYAIDPKLGIETIDGPDLDEDVNDPEDREAIETIAGIPLVVNRARRPAVPAFFERWGSQVAVLNGIWVGAISHPACTLRVFTGTRSEAKPDVAAITGAAIGSATPIPYMDLSGGGFAGPLAAYMGRTGINNQLELLLDRQTRLRGPRGSDLVYPGAHPPDADQVDIRRFLEARSTRMAEASYAHARADQRVQDVLESRERADALRSAGAGFADQLQLGRQANLAEMAPTIADLLRSGLCQTVSVEVGVDFDTHDDNTGQHAAWNATAQSLSTLMEALESAGQLEDTVVAVLSEMTRTPRRNASGGKDHWPVTGLMVMGAGVAGGRVLGGTNAVLDAQPVDLATGELTSSGIIPGHDHVAAGILELVGVDPAEWLPNVEVYRGFVA